MTENFLVTRPKLQSGEVADLLENQGYEVILEPISTIESIKYQQNQIEELKNKQIQAVLISSFNASETFLSFDFDKNVKIFAIGEKTVRKIRENGYKNIFLPEKSTILELEKLFLQENPGQTGEVLYFCGNYLTRDLSLSLEEYKFDVKNIMSYLADYHESFSEEFLELAKKKKIDNLLSYSKNNIDHFAKLTKKHFLDRFFDEINVIAISDEVANEARNLGFKKVKVFSDYDFLKN